jgi:hypothetical protein
MASPPLAIWAGSAIVEARARLGDGIGEAGLDAAAVIGVLALAGLPADAPIYVPIGNFARASETTSAAGALLQLVGNTIVVTERGDNHGFGRVLIDAFYTLFPSPRSLIGRALFGHLAPTPYVPSAHCP